MCIRDRARRAPEGRRTCGQRSASAPRHRRAPWRPRSRPTTARPNAQAVRQQHRVLLPRPTRSASSRNASGGPDGRADKE
eukprot:11499531-Alexandrium_andersonii.AAC.1